MKINKDDAYCIVRGRRGKNSGEIIVSIDA
jgi:hypothetical protein